jgi:putative transposase
MSSMTLIVRREALGIDIAVSLPAERITRYLDKLAEYHGYPLKIRVDNGSEFTGKTFINWAKSHDIAIDYWIGYTNSYNFFKG